jgi:excisionase family DNA binding protein
MSSFSRNLKSVDEVAEERRWSPKRVRRLICEGLPVVKIGRQRLINDTTLDQYLQKREAPRFGSPTP